MSSRRDASDTIRQKKQRALFADKAVQESALQNSIKNHLVLEGGIVQGPMTYDPHYTNVVNGELQTTPEELAAYKASAVPSPPDAPYGVIAAPGNASARVTFSTPTNTGSTPITSYTVTASPGGATATGANAPITVTGLTNGTAYTFTVIATNIVGNSEPSTPSASTTPYTIPSAPINLVGTPGDSQVVVTFTPGFNGGSPITNYAYSRDNGVSWVHRGPESPTASITIEGLVNNAPYKIKIRAMNIAGDGIPSDTLYISPLPFPGIQLYLDSAKFQTDVSGATTWHDYSGQSKHAIFNTITSWAPGNGGRLNFNGTNQFATVPTGFADFTSGITVIVIADMGDTNAWERIVDFGTGQQGNNILLGRRGSSNTDVFFEIYNGASSGFAAAKAFITNNQWNVFGGRLDGTTYAMIDAQNITSTGFLGGSASFLPNNLTRTSNFIGKSNWPADAIFQRRMAVVAIFNTALTDTQITQFIDYHRGRFVPSPPTGLSASAGNGQATITFTQAEGSDNGAEITNYQYSFNGVHYYSLSPADASSPITITGLTNGTTYNITLKAVNRFGASTASESVSVTPTAPPTGSPRVLILGDADVVSMPNALNSAKSDLGYIGTMTFTLKNIVGTDSAYTGSDITTANYDVVILWMNGGTTPSSSLGTNINSYVASGGNLIMATFAWGIPLANLSYPDVSTYARGANQVLISSGFTHLTNHPIVRNINPTSVTFPSKFHSSNISLLTGATSIASFTTTSTSAIAVRESGSANLVGFNIAIRNIDWAFTSERNLPRYVVNGIYWCIGALV